MTDSKWTRIQLKSLSEAVGHGVVFTGKCVLNVGRKLQFEAPVRFQDLWCYQGMRIGAYSFMRSAYVSGSPVIGRYCSIGANFSIGEPDHPTAWLGTSSVQYQKSKFAFYPPMKEFVPRERPEEGDEQKTIVGSDVWIGSNVMVLKGVKIGNGAVVAAGAVVTRDVEPYTIVGGVPAKLIRNRFADHGLVGRLKKLKWWEFLGPSLSGVPFDDPSAAIKEITRREKAGEISRSRGKFASIQATKDGFELVRAKETGEEAVAKSDDAPAAIASAEPVVAEEPAPEAVPVAEPVPIDEPVHPARSKRTASSRPNR